MTSIKNAVIINDMSGLGRCSLTVAIPIISVLGIQSCPFPTAILSCHTGYDKFSFLDLTEEMPKYEDVWNNLQINFDCIYSGFLGSEQQIDIVMDFINKHPESLVVVDPVMADDGLIYATYTEAMCNKLKDLVSLADLVTPNITECCILTGKKYNPEEFTMEFLTQCAIDISNMGPKKVVITGIVKGDEIWNLAYDKEEDKSFIVKAPYNHKSYCGTGDILSSIICGMVLNGAELKQALEKACDFIHKSINYTCNFNTEPREGIIFEPFLKELIL